MKYAAVVVLFALWFGPVFSAEGIVWESDYAKAVSKAAAQQRPLLLDFGMAGCAPCRKLDTTTFRDPQVIRQVGERLVAVKVDATRDVKIADALQVTSYPTVIVAAPNGDILARHEGYIDAAGMTRWLSEALTRAGRPVARPAAGHSDSARALFDQARQDYDDGLHLCCVERCDRLTRTFPNAAEAELARRLARRAMAAGGDEVADLIARLRRGE